jgi:hypothetical protein
MVFCLSALARRAHNHLIVAPERILVHAARELPRPQAWKRGSLALPSEREDDIWKPNSLSGSAVMF